MPTNCDSNTVNDAFFEPLQRAEANVSLRFPCREFPDWDWLLMGVSRVLEASPSGRGFLQEHGPRFENNPTLANYFTSFRSERRRDVAHQVNRTLVAEVNERLPDRLAEIPELDNYACFACDGHWHKAAVHDPRHDGQKMAVGHFYSINLRSHALDHLAAGEGLHGALKRIKPKGLRQGVRKGTRVIIVYDKAGIDFAYWKRCR